MARESKKQVKTQSERQPLYMTSANPPKQRRAFLILMTILVVLWVGLLSSVAWIQFAG